MTRALLVDLGNVLVGFDHGITCRRIAEATGVGADRLRPVLFGDLETDFDRGLLAPDAFFRACEERAGLPRLDDGVWVAAWRDIFVPFPEALAALAAVPAGVRRVLVSNTNALHWDGVLRLLDPSALVDELVLSFRVGAVKPSREFWAAALAAAGCEPRECLYADDRPELVASAAELGVPGFVVEGPRSLRAGLAARGLGAGRVPPPGNSGAAAGVRIS